METLSRLSPERLEEEIPFQMTRFLSNPERDERQALLLAYRRLYEILAGRVEEPPYRYLTSLSPSRLRQDVNFLLRLESDCLSEALIGEIRDVTLTENADEWISPALAYAEQFGNVPPSEAGWTAGYARIFFEHLGEAVISDNLLFGVGLVSRASVGLAVRRFLPSEPWAYLDAWNSAHRPLSAFQRLIFRYAGSQSVKAEAQKFWGVYCGFLRRKQSALAAQARRAASAHFQHLQKEAGERSRRVAAPEEAAFLWKEAVWMEEESFSEYAESPPESSCDTNSVS